MDMDKDRLQLLAQLIEELVDSDGPWVDKYTRLHDAVGHTTTWEEFRGWFLDAPDDEPAHDLAESHHDLDLDESLDDESDNDSDVGVDNDLATEYDGLAACGLGRSLDDDDDDDADDESDDDFNVYDPDDNDHLGPFGTSSSLY